LRGAKDSVAEFEFVVGGILAGYTRDDAREFRAADPRERRLVLVFAADLEQVVEVGGGCVDVDGVLVGLRIGLWEVRDFEVEGAL